MAPLLEPLENLLFSVLFFLFSFDFTKPIQKVKVVFRFSFRCLESSSTSGFIHEINLYKIKNLMSKRMCSSHMNESYFHSHYKLYTILKMKFYGIVVQSKWHCYYYRQTLNLKNICRSLSHRRSIVDIWSIQRFVKWKTRTIIHQNKDWTCTIHLMNYFFKIEFNGFFTIIRTDYVVCPKNNFLSFRTKKRWITPMN